MRCKDKKNYWYFAIHNTKKIKIFQIDMYNIDYHTFKKSRKYFIYGFFENIFIFTVKRYPDRYIIDWVF
jgi:hypothetical protein